MGESGPLSILQEFVSRLSAALVILLLSSLCLSLPPFIFKYLLGETSSYHMPEMVCASPEPQRRFTACWKQFPSLIFLTYSGKNDTLSHGRSFIIDPPAAHPSKKGKSSLSQMESLSCVSLLKSFGFLFRVPAHSVLKMTYTELRPWPPGDLFSIRPLHPSSLCWVWAINCLDHVHCLQETAAPPGTPQGWTQRLLPLTNSSINPGVWFLPQL